jgi:hypothetical protein
MGDGVLDKLSASFDKLRMRVFLSARKTAPHPELVEGRMAAVQHLPETTSLNVEPQDWRL